jgi:phosphate uptake regulator
MLGDPRTIEPGTDLILMSRHLERVGDHATNIAEDVIFIVEARDVRHGSGGQVTTNDQASITGKIVERRKHVGAPPV